MEGRYSPVYRGGGLYHHHKAKYSSETHSLIKRLLDESKLSILQRKTLHKSIKDGDPLPGPLSASGRNDHKKIQKEILIRPMNVKKRTQEAILESGAYEPERYFTTVHPKDNEKEKLRLQNLMAYGKEESLETKTVKTQIRMAPVESAKHKKDQKQDMFEHLLQEIEEREEFLEEMDKLGEGKKYQEKIVNEIVSKMRNMEMIDKDRFQKQGGTVAKYRSQLFNSRGPPKSLPLSAIVFPNS